MILIEENFDFISAIFSFMTLIVLILVVIKRKKFLGWFFVLFFGSLGGFIYYFRNYYPFFREIADLIYLLTFFTILIISISDYFKFVKFTSVTKLKISLQFFILSFLSLILSSLIYLSIQNQVVSISLWILLYTLLIMVLANAIYLYIIIKAFSVTKVFFFLSIFTVLMANLATDASFFGIQIFWDLSYYLTAVTYIFFISCSLTVLFEDQLNKISSDLAVLQTIIELAPVGVAIFHNNKIQLVNSSMSKINDYSTQEMKSWSIEDILSTFNQENKLRILKSIERTQDFNGEFEETFLASFITKKRKIKWGEFYVKTTEFQGYPTNFVLLIDVTEKFELEEKFKIAFLSSPYPIVLIDGETNKFVLFNEQFIEMFGYEPKELNNMEFNDLSLPEDILNQNLSYRDTIAHTDGFKYKTQKSYKRKNGSIIETIVATTFIMTSPEKGFFVTQLVDLSYLNEIEYYKKIITSLEQANNELKSLNQIVSHDVKAPLNAINNLLELIDQDYNNLISSDLKQLFNQMKVKTTYTSNLIKEILDYSSVGFFEEELENIITINLLEDIRTSLQVPKNFSMTFDPNLPNLRISKIRIQQLFQNLFSNAIKFNDKPDGKIFVGYKDLANGYHEFYVQDNGIGIPDNDIPSLFQVFKSLRKSPDSTGLGLAIVKKIVQFYEGEVKISSILGVETIVSFTLPNRYVINK